MTDRGDIFAGLLLAIIAVAIVNYGDFSAAPLGNGLENESDNGTIVQGLSQEQAERVQTVSYELTPAERDLIEHVVMGEAGGESTISQMAVAQCILNTCEITGNRPDNVISCLRYTLNRPEPSEQVKKAVAAVFDNGEKVIDTTVLYFYVPDREASPWHETQKHVCTIEGRRFFERRENNDTSGA